jgi:hypothetical protein
MRWVVLACGLACACNRILGVSGDIRHTDAAIYDGLPDAAHQCPPPGTIPVYSPIIRPAIMQDCHDYTASADTGLAIAQCKTDAGGLDIFEGGHDRMLVQLPGFPQLTPDFSVSTPRLSPEGDILMLVTFDLTTTTSAYPIYHRMPDGTWHRGTDANLPQFGTISVTSRGPDRHIMLCSGTSIVQEWHDSGTTTWTHVRDIDFGPTAYVRAVWLSPDGLRLLATDGAGGGTSLVMRYADRTAIADPFSTPVPIALPASFDTFITEDCTRVYMSALETVFYVLEK